MWLDEAKLKLTACSVGFGLRSYCCHVAWCCGVTVACLIKSRRKGFPVIGHGNDHWLFCLFLFCMVKIVYIIYLYGNFFGKNNVYILPDFMSEEK